MNTLKMNFISAMRIMAVIAMIGNVAAWTRMTGGKAAFIKRELTTKNFKYCCNNSIVTEKMRLNAVQYVDQATFEEVMDIVGFDVESNAMVTLC